MNTLFKNENVEIIEDKLENITDNINTQKILEDNVTENIEQNKDSDKTIVDNVLDNIKKIIATRIEKSELSKKPNIASVKLSNSDIFSKLYNEISEVIDNSRGLDFELLQLRTKIREILNKYENKHAR